MIFRSMKKERRLRFGLAVLVALATFLVYLPSLGNDFVIWDDDVNVIENQHIRSLDRSFLKWAITDLSTATYWHPIVWFTFAVDHAIWGLDPFGYHLTALLIHVMNTFLVVLLTGMLGAARGQPSPDPPSAKGRESVVMTAAVITGVLFGLHPIHVESVAWISERKDLLYSLFFLLSVMAYVRYTASPGGEDPGTGRDPFYRSRWYLLSLALFVLSLASKPMAVTLPLVIMILDWYPLGMITSFRSLRRSFREKLPFIALSLIVTIATLFAQQTAAMLPALKDVPAASRVLVAFWALIMYLWKMLVPLELIPLYPYPKSVAFWSGEYLLPVLLVAGVTAACVAAARRRKIFLSCWAYYVITLLPVLGLLQVGSHSMADRFTYLPSLGPFILAGTGAAQGWAWLGTFSTNGRTLRAASTAAVIILAVVLSWMTVRQAVFWKDSVSLWSYVIEKEPGRVPLAYNNRGIAYERAGKHDLALKDFTAALSLEQGSPFTHNNRGMLFLDSGQPDLALSDFNSAIAQDPSFAKAYANRGKAYRMLGKREEALQDYTKALQLQPDFAGAYLIRGVMFGEEGDHERAIEEFTLAVKADPYYSDAYTARGLSYEQSGQFERAIEDLDRAVSLKPSNVDAYLNRGVTYVRMNKYERAIEDYDRAIDLSPSDFLLYCNRGMAFREMGRLDDAIKDYTHALSLKPDFAQGYVDRGDLYRKAGRRDLAHRDYQKACYLGSRNGCTAMQDGRGSGGHQ